MDLQLRDRVALITGGASGIGRACADALAEEGAQIALLDRDPAGEEVAALLRDRGHEALFVRADVTVEADVRTAVAAVLDRFGRLDTVLGCAGISGPAGTPAAEVSVADWDQVMAVNVRGNFLLAKHTVPALRPSPVATIVLIASDAALVAFEGMSAYNTSKGAVLMLTRSLSVDHPEVRVNCLCPGVVDTPMSRADLGRPDGFAGSDLPVMQPADLARHAAFLASPVSAPINGTSVVSDFGYLARPAVPPYEFATDPTP
ncbi:SDR family NAD(P)-dependent oxidoreductase [Modestobacter sp. VKM Ac-2977]|uniref:SDR family NAD(P)-dependent oxidoreductase n=1 Tax=Modestobacter sp. VKM Ac-2977 TaxID=3004131 RepID=UPI0022AACF91|nr:SDR family oxidoreductase [Modestobacter sp. VKM Ac-2977]MCZ2820258.1 SDR family NAD(P)-dependent oxidoreductase [Modestobacter sp. VKM Ac-2977]